ncbi:MAG: hypothetical protein ACOYON_02475 [Fimbriimonas sp.]
MQTLRTEPTAAQRLTSEEAAAILKLAAARESAGSLTTADLAETLAISEDEVARLLVEVRGRNRSQAPAQTPPSHRRDSTWIASLVAALLILVFAGFAVPRLIHNNENRTTSPDLAAIAPVAQALVPRSTVPAGLSINVEGQPYTLGTTWSSEDEVFRFFRLHGEDLATRLSGTEPTESMDGTTLTKVQSGIFDAPFITHHPVVVMYRGPEGASIAVAKTTLPIYSGGDTRIAQVLDQERARRYKELSRRVQELVGTPSGKMR